MLLGCFKSNRLSYFVGLEQELHILHDMIMGDSRYSTESIFKSIERNLTSQQNEIFDEYTISLQASGYALLISAYLIKEWNIEGVQQIQAVNIAEQKELLMKLNHNSRKELGVSLCQNRDALKFIITGNRDIDTRTRRTLIITINGPMTIIFLVLEQTCTITFA